MKDALGKSHKLYDARNYKDSATAFDEALKFQAFEPALSYNLALCYHQLGDRMKAVEYLRQAHAGTVEPKQRQKIGQMLTFFTTDENGVGVKDSDRDRIARVNQLTDSIGIDASLEDKGGVEEPFFEDGAPTTPLAQTALPPSAKASTPAGTSSDSSCGP